jgi:hypothetical protein
MYLQYTVQVGLQPLRTVCKHDKTGELGSIYQAGRRYLIDGAGSITKGVDILIDVRDDLSQLLVLPFTRESVAVRHIEHPYEQPSVPTDIATVGTKRVRLTHCAERRIY